MAKASGVQLTMQEHKPMSIKMINKYKVLLVLALVVIASVFFFFYRMYHNDVKALKNFLVSYETFDKAIADYSLHQTDSLGSKAGDALIELNTKAILRLSSLIKNDAELMGQALEITACSGKELESLMTVQKAGQDNGCGLDGLTKEYDDWTAIRKAAYARFQRLSPFKD